MQVIKSIKTIQELIKEYKKHNFSIGFVPTMGYLHEGHLSLIQKARKNDKVIVSIFVNPMQFGANEDLDKYPRALQKDSKLCEENGVDLLFVPEVAALYPKDFYSFVDVNVLGDNLCGASRKGHFKGVCTILMKFFNIIEPDFAYFGQKDAQQCMIVKAMVRDLNLKVQIELCPIIREKDGLAKSSRNVYLNEQERKAALVLSKSLNLAYDLFKQGQKKSKILIQKMQELILKEKLARIDYVKIVDLKSLQELEIINHKALCALAVFIGKTRLIDNIILE